LERATAPAQTTHLQNIRDVKKIGCMGRRVLSALDRRQQIVTLDWFREDFGVCNFKSLFGRGIIWKKQNLKRRKNFAERRTEREPIDPLGFELGQEKITLVMTTRPIQRRDIAANELTLVPRVRVHHLHQRFPHLRVAVHDEQLHYCGGAVLGAGKIVKSLVGSARLSWS